MGRKEFFQQSPVKIHHKGFRFLITDRPSTQNMSAYIQELQRNNVSVVVRVCEPSYKTELLDSQGIEVYNMEYEDGTFPSNDIVTRWLKLLKAHFAQSPDMCVAVHCVAGLGRAPVMVAISLIELGMRYEEAVELIREKKRGAINAKQLDCLAKYRPKSRLKTKKFANNRSCCVQ